MKKLSTGYSLWMGLFLLIIPQVSIGQMGASEQEFQLLLSWFDGSFTNEAQVLQEKADEVPEEFWHDHIYSIFKRVDMPHIGAHVFFVKQYMDGDTSKVYRQRIYTFEQDKLEDAIRLDIWAFINNETERRYRNADEFPELLKGLQQDALRPTPGCEVYWRRHHPDFFEGTMKEKSCNFISSRSGKRIFIDDNLRLYADAIWINDQATDEDGNYVFGHKAKIPHQLKKVSD